ncbi:MAG: hypothetical protein JNL39_19495, partial [Opitutaceae bacterium]|nr:hypothetical protein [Opitutaceae bacterium]
GTPGVTASGLRLRGAGLIPDNLNASGSGQNRDAALRNLTLTADWQPLPHLAINLAHNFQYSRAMVRLLGGAEPALRGDANATQGIGGPANPFAGRLYFDGNWQRHFHIGQVRETRLSASYLLEPRPAWLGRHRLAAMVSQAEQFDWVSLGFLVLKGRPYNAVAANAPNRLTVRHYITEGSWATYRAGDWRAVPAAINFDGRTFATEWANSTNNSNNSGADQESRSALGVVQSRFFGDRLVTTVGYRQDKVDVFELGYYNEPDIGQIVDRDRSKARLTSATGFTGNIGAVWHVRDWVSVIANRSNNRGVPSFTRRTFPDATLAPPSEGEGKDVGLGFDLLGGRVSARVTYFESSETNLVTQNGVAGAPARNARVADAFEGALVGAGRPYTAAQWQPIEAALAPPVTGATSDAEASGYEARLTANLTRNWRLVLNYSYSDFIRTNVGAEVIEWYGLKDASGRLQQGVRQDTAGRFVADPAAFEAGKTVAKWLELGAQAPQANVSTLTTSTGQTVAQEIFALVDTMNAERDNEQKRWGLRPHKVSVFTAYDFKEGALTGFTAGGGWRWRSANVIGANSRGGEIFGRALVSTDLMLAYTRKFARLPGRVRFQLNVYNVLDKTEFIPVRLATGVTAPDGFFVPGGRGLAYSRYDMVAPRELRFTTTYSF